RRGDGLAVSGAIGPVGQRGGAQNGLLHLVGADVHGAADARGATLVGAGQPRGRTVAGINGRAAGPQGHRRRGAAVVLHGAQQAVNGTGGGAALVPVGAGAQVATGAGAAEVVVAGGHAAGDLGPRGAARGA